ncbi:MAG: hypothetical protein ACKVH8_17200 [Pirellulales bacterium]
MNNGARGIVAVICTIVALFIAVMVAVVLLGLIFLRSSTSQFNNTRIAPASQAIPVPAPAIPAPLSKPIEIQTIEDLKPIIVTPETIESENLEIEIINPPPEPATTDISS